MRDITGSAAAPAARCRTRRRESFILNLPPTSLHSITSSARKSTEGGIVRSRDFAVLRFMTNSNFVGCSTGRSDGLTPLKSLATKCCLSPHRRKIGPIGYQPPGLGVFLPLIDCRKTVFRREGDDLAVE